MAGCVLIFKHTQLSFLTDLIKRLDSLNCYFNPLLTSRPSTGTSSPGRGSLSRCAVTPLHHFNIFLPWRRHFLKPQTLIKFTR